MPRPARFKYTKTDRGWLVNVTAKHSASGKREQRYFPTREKAKEFAAELREKAENHGKASSSITPRLRDAAAARGTYTVTPVLPVDIIGLYIYQPQR